MINPLFFALRADMEKGPSPTGSTVGKGKGNVKGHSFNTAGAGKDAATGSAVGPEQPIYHCETKDVRYTSALAASTAGASPAEVWPHSPRSQPFS